jgi:hypothetical protein
MDYENPPQQSHHSTGVTGSRRPNEETSKNHNTKWQKKKDNDHSKENGQRKLIIAIPPLN